MSDDRPPMPKQPTTVALQAPPDWAIALTKSVVDGFAGVEQRLDTMETNLEIQGGSVVDLGKRMTNLEERVGKTEGRQGQASLKVSSISESDMAQDAELAKEKTAREALAERVAAIEEKVGTIYRLTTGFLSNPKVLAAGRIAFLLLAGYAASKGVRLLP